MQAVLNGIATGQRMKYNSANTMFVIATGI
jgi:hypothetical protein